MKMKVKRVKVHSPALRSQVMKSGGLQALLASEAQAAAARCNAAADPSIRAGAAGSLYGGFSSVHSSTAVGVVATRGAAGKLDDLKRNTLRKATGW